MEFAEQRYVVCFSVDGMPESLIACLKSAGWVAYFADNVEQACNIIKTHNIHVGLAMITRQNEQCDLSAIERILLCTPRVEWIGLTENSNLNYALVTKLISKSFYDYHTLPHDKTNLLVTLGHAYGMAEMKWHHHEQDEHDYSNSHSMTMVGNSPQLIKLVSEIKKIAGVNAPVLIIGESGTGKELAAKAIHDLSNCSNGAFVVVNCGAIPNSLIQSELFGSEKGAFTGANARRKGYIEAADAGSLFLDEIGDLGLDQQVNLLRFLQEGTIQRVGGTELIKLNVRVIAATHVNLEKAVEEGRFREDLYYRLNVIKLKTPSLRDRPEDIDKLAQYFFDKFSDEKGRYVKGFSQECINTMRFYAWKGNVREMINRIRQAMIMTENSYISASDLGIHGESPNFNWVTLKEIKDRAEQDAIRKTLQRAGNNISLAARHLSISRVMLYRLIDKYDITL